MLYIPMYLNATCLAGNLNVACKSYLSEFTGTVLLVGEKCFAPKLCSYVIYQQGLAVHATPKLCQILHLMAASNITYFLSRHFLE